MFDLTGTHLAGYMLRILRDIVAANPRFRSALGEVSFQNSNQLLYKDVQIIVKDITAQGTRLSPDYFIATQHGRALVAPIEDHPGTFISWIDEIDPTHQTPVSGVYLLAVQSVDEGTREVGFMVETYKWYQGRVGSAKGTRVVLRPGIDGTSVAPYDLVTGLTPRFTPALGFLDLLSQVNGLGIRDQNGNALTPVTDYWIEQTKTTTLIEATVFGQQVTTIPNQYLAYTILDEDDFTLRPGVDYTVLLPGVIQLSAWTPSGTTILVTGPVKADPTIPGNCVAPENILAFTVGPNETLVASQTQVSTQDGANVPVSVHPDGSVSLEAPLPPGGWCRFDARVLVNQSKGTGVKMSSNVSLIPGLRIAIGDQVQVGDQCAVLVSPTLTETYRVWGSTDNVNFTIEVRSNDPSTSSELIELLKAELLIRRRQSMEADGLTILEASRSMSGNGRDRSGTAPTFLGGFQVTALADWRVYQPLVNRIVDIDITAQPSLRYRRAPRSALRYSTFGFAGFFAE